MSSESIQELKDKLQSLGISTNTPGLKGDQRKQELLNRLEEYEMKLESLNNSGNNNNNKSNENNNKNNNNEMKNTGTGYNIPSVSDLSLTEIRSRLTMLGESTNTPGLTGEDRRNELLKRLINSICRSDDTGDQFIDDLLTSDSKTSNNYNTQNNVKVNEDNHEDNDNDRKHEKKGENIEKEIEISKFLFIPTQPLEVVSEEEIIKSKQKLMKKEERIKTTELSEIKKHLNNIVNRRAIVISSRYEGDNRDEKLHQLGNLLNQIEQEIKRVQNLSKKSKSDKVVLSSSQLIDNNTKMSIDNLLTKLNKEYETTKEKIKRQKNKIKYEEENNPVYGVEVEEADKVRIQELNYEIAKIKRDIEKISVGVQINESLSLQSLQTSQPPLSKSSPSFEYSEGKSDFKKVSSESDSKNDSNTLKHKGRGLKKQVQSKNSFDSFGGNDIGLTEEDLAAIKPFEPYKDTKDDDLLSLKMEMLRNRHKVNKKADINVDNNNNNNNNTTMSNSNFLSSPIQYSTLPSVTPRLSTSFSDSNSCLQSLSSSYSPFVATHSRIRSHSTPVIYDGHSMLNHNNNNNHNNHNSLVTLSQPLPLTQNISTSDLFGTLELNESNNNNNNITPNNNSSTNICESVMNILENQIKQYKDSTELSDQFLDYDLISWYKLKFR